MKNETENIEKMPEEYSKLLKSYKKSDDEIGEDFQARINARLEEVAAQKRRKAKFIAFSKYATAATAAIFVIIFAVLFSKPTTDEAGEKISESIVAKGDPVTINLVYDTAEDLENVKFGITLDDGVSFLSSNEKIRNTRTHEWTGSLKKGKNSIPFVVKTERDGRMEITTTAEYGNYSHKHKIVLDAQKNDIKVSMFVFAPSPLN
ncbi:hypothetical protein IJG44_02200 [bacterium]|nr:hypothetical protein [bacterium]